VYVFVVSLFALTCTNEWIHSSTEYEYAHYVFTTIHYRSCTAQIFFSHYMYFLHTTYTNKTFEMPTIDGKQLKLLWHRRTWSASSQIRSAHPGFIFALWQSKPP